MTSSVRLRPLRVEDEIAAIAAHEDLAVDYHFFLDRDPDEAWVAYVDRMERWRRGIDLPADRVRAAFLVAWVDDQIVGRSSIRFELNEYLATAGGHIGYAVLPQHRRKGHATEILRQSVVIARAEGVDDLLVTCSETNVGSRAVIEACGGDYESSVHDPKENVQKRRYWIR